MKKKIFVVLSISSILLSACGSSTSASPSQPTPTVTQTTISTPTMAVTATPTWTSKPEPIAINEIKQYPICTAENYSECVIPYQDLFDGNYFNWLNTLAVDPFDASKVERVQCYGSSTGQTYIGKLSVNNFGNPQTSMVKRGTTVGITTIKNGEVGYNFYGTREYLILPAYAFSESKDSGVWLIFVFPTGALSENQKKDFIDGWNNSWTLMVIANTYFSGINSSNNTEDPLVVNTFKLFPDMQNRLDNFGINCDPGYISGQGIVLESSYSK